MSGPPYRRPPITEAVVELRLVAPIEVEQVEKIKERLANRYPLLAGSVQNIEIVAGPGQNAAPKMEFSGYRLTSTDATDVAIVARQNITTSRLAPYNGWEDFIAGARSNWEVWRKVVGWREVSRLGVRYINRIDIPNPDQIPIPTGDYLIFRPVFPEFEGGEGVDIFGINGQMAIANSPFRLILNAGTALSPLVRTTSFLLDIDISQDGNIPRNDDSLWTLIDQVRMHKNRVFEASITDLARKLFSS